ncbi:unnamed protein product [Urochloa decumbens]|uniref:UBC core domain-containing protein n=1 Tax=Urochloa decumbens TaxID=240449 RepID=A0ABC9CTI3_9POAL
MMASRGLAICRLAEERSAGARVILTFVAKPEKLPDGSVNLLLWNCIIPGKQGTDWEGGYFPLTLQFSEYYPDRPPTCKFPAGFFHVNVYDTGAVCLSLLGDHGILPSPCGKFSYASKSCLIIQIQTLVHNVSFIVCFAKNMPEYKKRVCQQVKRYSLLVSAQGG